MPSLRQAQSPAVAPNHTVDVTIAPCLAQYDAGEFRCDRCYESRGILASPHRRFANRILICRVCNTSRLEVQS